MNDIEKKFIDWIINFLSIPNEITSGLPICPYAKNALLKKEINFFHVDKENYKNFIVLNKPLLVLSFSEIDFNEFLEIKNSLKIDLGEKYEILADHKDDLEIIDDVCLNFLHSNLILIQEKKIIEEARNNLLKTNYYSKWPGDYMKNFFK